MQIFGAKSLAKSNSIEKLSWTRRVNEVQKAIKEGSACNMRKVAKRKSKKNDVRSTKRAIQVVKLKWKWKQRRVNRESQTRSSKEEV